MRISTRGGVARRLTAVSATAALALTGATALATPSEAATGGGRSTAAAAVATPDLSGGRYLVAFVDEPAATYDGGLAGYPRTRPDAGQKLRPERAEVVKYRNRLTSIHDQALAKVNATKLYDYSVVTNGVAVELTAAQARSLAATPGVVSLEKDARRTVDTTYSPTFLGLNAPGGLWSQLGGDATAGRGVIVGVVDSGIWPESPSFAGSTLRHNKAGQPIDAQGQRMEWSGACVQGEQFSSQDCNDKLIGARYYVAGFGKKNIAKEEYLSPRDGGGHGSHTASTAAGNKVQNVTIDGTNYGTASGMAPGAQIAAYKVCWEAKPGASAGCFNSDSVAAINDAVADGVDVINYSVGGSSESSPLDSVEQAYLRAARVGIFVANSAGNSGPGAATLDHPSPWLTTVAASTFRTSFQAVKLGDGQRFVGASLTQPLAAQTPLVSSASIGKAGADPKQVALCYPGTLDPAKATGKIVQCDRGVIARIDKGYAVQQAGGVGLILTNTSPNSLNADLHPVSAVHINEVDGAAVKKYIASAGSSATAAILPLSAAEQAAAPTAPAVAEFSSRGPSTTTNGDVLKPDISAPGVDVIAAVAPPSNHGRLYDAYSGTSMSSPHIAGIAALVKAAHPTWTPMMVKSALMTTARDNTDTSDPFAQGAGFVVPNSAVEPGLVFDAGYRDWLSYIEGSFGLDINGVDGIDGSDLNQASIAIGALAGKQTVTRTVTNVAGKAETYTVSASVGGVAVSASPTSFTIGAGKTQTVTFTVTTDGAPLGSWAKGFVNLRSSAHSVRVPVAVRPVAISAPTEIAGSGTSGKTTVTVTPGFSGTLSTSVTGLVGATPQAGTVTSGALTTTDSPSTKVYTVTVDPGATLARFDLNSLPDGDDLDLYVYRGSTLVGLSASSAGDEQVTLRQPTPGTYTVLVNGYSTASGGGYELTNWVLGTGDAGNLVVDPASTPVTLATPTTLSLTWSGLTAGQRYLGYLSYSGAEETTVVTIG